MLDSGQRLRWQVHACCENRAGESEDKAAQGPGTETEDDGLAQEMPGLVLALGPVPTTGENEVFKNPANGKTTFTIQAEKVPNRKGVERIIELLGGPKATLDELGVDGWKKLFPEG